MKLQELYRRTSDERKYLAQFVRMVKTQQGRLDSGEAFIAAKTESVKRIDSKGFLVPVPSGERNTHVTAIVFTDRKLNVKVGCSCQDAKFRWEFANAQKGAADIYYSNGQPPVVTNPALRVSMCKHLVALYLKIAHKLPRT